MLFPFRNRARNQLAVGDRIDRYAALNSARLFGGLAINTGFSEVTGALVVSEGRGRHLRIRHIETESMEIPEHLTSSLRAQSQQETGERLQVLQDLAQFQAGVFAQLKRKAGKFVDRILCLAVSDPGFWSRDFDGRLNYMSACDPNRLAEWTGVSVIDALPARDLAAGGTGKWLESLPLWLWLADRNPKVAQYSTALVSIDRDATLYLLPGSDGLDEILPAIEVIQLTIPSRSSGEQFVDQLISWLARPRTGVLPLRQTYLAMGTLADAAFWGATIPKLHESKLPSVLIDRERVVSPGVMNSVAAAIHGAAFADQMPANLPGLTGATGQRILGRITPGSPACWRNLLVAMTDCLAPTMKLKDAI